MVCNFLFLNLNEFDLFPNAVTIFLESSAHNISKGIDNSVISTGKHVINLFIQYTPYKPSDGSWEDSKYRVSQLCGLYTKFEFLYLIYFIIFGHFLMIKFLPHLYLV